MNSPNIGDTDIEFNPKYNLLDPIYSDDNWSVKKVEVNVVNIARTYQGLRDSNIWLGSRSGMYMQLNNTPVC